MALLSAVLLLAASRASSSPPTPASGPAAAQERPRVCLALGGGGTRGAAHLGVLKVLEELQVPVDCIAGTSMGAVVGGLYAAGYSPAELEAVLGQADWRDLLRGRPPRQTLSFRRKEDDRRYPANFEIGIAGGKLKFPRGVLSTVNLDFLLQRLTLRVAEIRDFDRLPIPFRAVTVDVAGGQKVVLDEGNLATAIRASMSIPGAFPPVPFTAVEGNGEMLLVDGSVVENLPVGEALAMGADVVIAVDVGTPLLTAEEVTSLTAVMGQAMSLAAAERTEEQRRRATLVLTPRLAGYGEFDFSDLLPVVALGADEAQRRRSELEVYSDADAFRAFLARQRRSDFKPGRVRKVAFDGAGDLDRRRLTARFRTAEGAPLDLELLRRDLEQVYQLGAFERVAVDLIPVPDARDSREAAVDYDVVVHLQRRPGSNSLLRSGIVVSDDLEGDTSLNLRLGITFGALNLRGGEWRNDFQLGRTRRAFSELYQPMDFAERWFVAPNVEYRLAVTNVFEQREKIAEVDTERRTARLDLGWRLGNAGEARIGLLRGRAEAEIGVGDPTLPRLRADLGGIVVQVGLDRLDGATVPRLGDLGSLEVFVSESSLGADDEFTKITGSYSRFLTRGRHTVFATVAGGLSADGDLPLYEELELGGLFSLSGYSQEELRGQYLGTVRGGYLARVRDLPVSLGSGVYAGGWLEAGNVWQSSEEVGTDDLIGTLTLAGAVDTRVGALYVAYGLADDGKGRFYISLGSRP